MLLLYTTLFNANAYRAPRALPAPWPAMAPPPPHISRPVTLPKASFCLPAPTMPALWTHLPYWIGYRALVIQHSSCPSYGLYVMCMWQPSPGMCLPSCLFSLSLLQASCCCNSYGSSWLSAHSVYVSLCSTPSAVTIPMLAAALPSLSAGHLLSRRISRAYLARVSLSAHNLDAHTAPRRNAPLCARYI